MAVDPASVQAAFLAAVEQTSTEGRAAVLDRLCGADAELRQRVEALLRAHDAPGSLLESPAPDLDATVNELPAAEKAGTVIGPYKLVQQVGEGGMGTVWMAEQTHPVRRKVALKLIKAGMDSRQVIARFEAERQALALMDHPNIARVFDAGATDTGRPYFVMELVKGVAITKYCDEHRLTPRERLGLFVPVCQAVQHAHQKGIIHRDLKPSNVLVALCDGRPVPKVIDFGVAKAAGQPLTDRTLVTGFGAVVGTLEYMSPEQAEVNQFDIDTRSDIYSLGVLLYELLAGSPPFSRKELEKAGMMEMLRVIREQEPSRPSTKLSTAEGLPTLAANRGTEPAKLTRLVRGELDWIVMKALEKDRNRRYETANGFAQDVERYLADEPVLAGPPSAWYRLRKAARRHRGPVVAVSLVALALVGGIIGMTWGMLEATAWAAEATAETGRKQTALHQKQEALTQVQQKEREAKITLGTFLLNKGVALCDEGKVGLGLLWLARALEVVPDDADDLQRVIRVNLAAWSHQVSHLRGILPPSKLMSPHFSPDGKILLRSGESVQGWDTATGQPIGPPVQMPERTASVLPGPDRSALAVNEEGAWRFDVVTGEALGPPLRFEGERFYDVSRDHKLVLTKKDNNTVRLWDIATGKAVGLPLSHPEEFKHARFSPDGRTVVTAGGKVARLWDAATGKPVGQPMTLTGLINGVAFSLDGKTVALWTDDNTQLQFCDAATGELKGPARAPNGWRVRDGLYIPPLGFDIDRAPGRRGLRGAFVGGSEPGAPQLVVLRPSGGFVLAHYEDGSGQLWNALTGQPVGAPLPSPHGRRTRAEDFNDYPFDASEMVDTFSPDGRRYVTRDEEYTYRLWEVGSGKPHRQILVPVEERRGYMLFSPDGRFMLGYSTPRNKDSEFQFARTTGEVIARFPAFRGPRYEIYAAAFGPDGRTILAVDDSPDTFLWVVEKGEFIQRWGVPVSWAVSDPGLFRPELWNRSRDVVALSPDGKTFLAGGGVGRMPNEEGVAQLMDLTRKPLGPPLRHPAPVQALAFSPDGKTLLTGCGHKDTLRAGSCEARLWDAATGQLIGRPLPHQGTVTAVAFSPDGKSVLTGSADRSARLWDAATGKALCPPLAHAGTVRAVAFDPSGRLVLTGTGDGAARLWDAATGKPLGPPLLHDHAVGFVSFGPDGQTVLTAGRRQSLRQWEVAIAPLAGGAEQVRLWVEVITGSELDRDGVVGRLDHETWTARSRRLQELGGPPRP